MSDYLPTVIGVAGGALGILGGAAAWVARAVVLDRLASLEASRDGMGRRFGDGLHGLDKRVAILEDRSKRP